MVINIHIVILSKVNQVLYITLFNGGILLVTPTQYEASFTQDLRDMTGSELEVQTRYLD